MYVTDSFSITCLKNNHSTVYVPILIVMANEEGKYLKKRKTDGQQQYSKNSSERAHVTMRMLENPWRHLESRIQETQQQHCHEDDAFVTNTKFSDEGQYDRPWH